MRYDLEKPLVKIVALKRLLVVGLLVAAGPAAAEWVNVGTSAGHSLFIDPTTIRKDGDFRKVWGIQDLKERDSEGELSRRYREEFDCNTRRKRFLSATTHSESMAGGKTLTTITESSPWSEIRANTVADDILKMVCAN
jgi:hypothetical protein